MFANVHVLFVIPMKRLQIERFSDLASVIGNNSWERGKKKNFPTFDSAGYETIFSCLSIWTSSRAINGHNLVTKIIIGLAA